MIPTVLLLGLAVGRWWLVPAAGLAWVALLVAVNGLAASEAPLAATLAIANAAVGVAAHKAVALLLRHVPGRRARRPDARPPV